MSRPAQKSSLGLLGPKPRQGRRAAQSRPPCRRVGSPRRRAAPPRGSFHRERSLEVRRSPVRVRATRGRRARCLQEACCCRAQRSTTCARRRDFAGGQAKVRQLRALLRSTTPNHKRRGRRLPRHKGTRPFQLSTENCELVPSRVSQSVSQLFHGPAPRSPLHRLSIRFRRSRSNTSTENSLPLPGATQLSQVRSISPSGPRVFPVASQKCFPPKVLPWFMSEQWE